MATVPGIAEADRRGFGSAASLGATLGDYRDYRYGCRERRDAESLGDPCEHCRGDLELLPSPRSQYRCSVLYCYWNVGGPVRFLWSFNRRIERYPVSFGGVINSTASAAQLRFAPPEGFGVFDGDWADFIGGGGDY